MNKSGWYNQPIEHSLAARGIKIKFNPDKFIKHDLKNYFVISKGKGVLLGKEEPKDIERRKSKGKIFGIVVESKLSKRQPASLMAFEMKADVEEVVEQAKEIANSNPNNVIFVGEFVGVNKNGDPIYQDLFSIRKRLGDRKKETYSDTDVTKKAFKEFTGEIGDSLEDNSERKKYKITGFKQQHLFNSRFKIQKSLFWYKGQPIMVRDADDIIINKDVFDIKLKSHRQLLAMVRRKIK